MQKIADLTSDSHYGRMALSLRPGCISAMGTNHEKRLMVLYAFYQVCKLPLAVVEWLTRCGK